MTQRRPQKCSKGNESKGVNWLFLIILILFCKLLFNMVSKCICTQILTANATLLLAKPYFSMLTVCRLQETLISYSVYKFKAWDSDFIVWHVLNEKDNCWDSISLQTTSVIILLTSLILMTAKLWIENGYGNINVLTMTEVNLRDK